jgi:hypothetical protein
LPFADRGLLLLTLHFAMLLGNTRKSGGPPPLEPPFKVKRDVHSQRSGFVVTPGVEGLNARGPLKVHPKWRHEESALATLRWRRNDRHRKSGLTSGLPGVVQGLLVRIANRLTSATERQSICRHTADTTHFRKIVEIQAVPD